MLDKFREPLDKKDLKSVITRVIITMILMIIATGILGYFITDYFNPGMIIINLLLGLGISYQIKNSYDKYHVVYSLIAVIILILTIVFGNLMMYTIKYNQLGIKFILIETFGWMNLFSKTFYSMINILYFISVILSCVFTHWYSKKN